MPSDKTGWVLDRVLRRRAETTPDRPFLEVVGHRCETYRETFEAALKLAARLEQLGVGKGDTVVIMAPNSFESVHAWIAANMLGAIDVTINTAYRGQLLEHALNMAQAQIILLDEEFLPVLQESEARLPHLETAVHFRTFGNSYQAPPPQFGRVTLRPLWEEPERPLSNAIGQAEFKDVASVIYTSGTTGPAKGVMMPHAQTYDLAQQTIRGLRLREDDVFYCFHPLFHMAGKFMAIYASMLAGGKIVLDARFAAEHWLERVRQYGATVGLAHGPMVEMIFDQPEGPDDADNPMRRMLACPLPKHIALEFEQRFDLRGYEVWGMTEINTPCWTPYDEPVRPGSCGKIIEDAVDFQIIDPETEERLPAGETGELVITTLTKQALPMVRYRTRDLTSLIDVVLLLLVFFMITTSFVRESRIGIRLPEARTVQPAEALEEPMVISVTAQGTYLVNGRVLLDNRPETLEAAIRMLAGENLGGKVTLSADAEATHQSVITAMDIAGKLGYGEINIATLKPENGED